MRIFWHLLAVVVLLVSSVAATVPNAICVPLSAGDGRRAASCTGTGCVNQPSVCNTVSYVSHNRTEFAYNGCRVQPYPVCYDCETTNPPQNCLKKDHYSFANCLGTFCTNYVTSLDCYTDSSGC